MAASSTLLITLAVAAASTKPGATDGDNKQSTQKWKSECAGGNNFTCNRKVIGARAYIGAGARDEYGHGSHTPSIAAGNKISGASFYGIAEGNARGGFDDAIADGVDIITCSFGSSNYKRPWEQNPQAIGAFHAMENGILTVNAAGNDGPEKRTMPSTAPWLFSVAASSSDHHIIDKIVLGNGKTFIGKIELCDHSGVFAPYTKALLAGATGVITMNPEVNDLSSFAVDPLPASTLWNIQDYDAVMSYFNSTNMNHTFFGKCPKHIKLGSPKDLNYPSMAVLVQPGQAFKIEFLRSVTNVGLSNSTYKATILTSSTSMEVKASVEPSTLSFKSLDEKKSFVVTVAGKSLPVNSMVYASLVWSDGTHNVRSPIVVYTELGPNFKE
ncbi:hypothetical protein EZV62_020870 [Acer yangbiense]|uniref:Subtilisin-like protease fibronectin type-III domain-containing protein n=1 Tax=Acer yangbiense TaxID=1000413 RepID=A0A5C7HF34_9ROSI|nr:hypothetical protein EZV62_020870 [Acer yangbiense]